MAAGFFLLNVSAALKELKFIFLFIFLIYEVEGFYNLGSEHKGADQISGYQAFALRICFRVCKNKAAHDGTPFVFHAREILYPLE